MRTMYMSKMIFQMILILIIPLNLFSQGKISKQEIYAQIHDNMNKHNVTGGYKTHFDSVVVHVLDSLKVSGVDTLGAYAEEYVGSYFLDTCQCGNIPWIASVQWVHNGETYYQALTARCHYKPVRISYSTLIRYYINCMTTIDKETIMPVITGASINKNGEILYDMEMVDHTTHFTIYCDVKGHSKFTTFEDYFLENKKNIFYNDNINSTINSWRKMIVSQINETENE